MRIVSLHTDRSRQKGFTIVELMIATVVFSVIVLVVSYGVIHFTTDYYKGINSSTTQTTARTVLNDVTQAIQFGATAPVTQMDGTATAWCIGNQQFMYSKGNLISSAPNYGVVQIPQCSIAATPGNGKELLQPHMRLVKFNLSQPIAADTTIWNVAVIVAYGDDDLLCSPSVTIAGVNSCSSNANLPTADYTNADLTCKLSAGSQFCDVASLSTTVKRRVK